MKRPRVDVNEPLRSSPTSLALCECGCFDVCLGETHAVNAETQVAFLSEVFTRPHASATSSR